MPRKSVMPPLKLALSILGAAAAAGPAWSGAMVTSCRELIAFPGANVNNYVKQFSDIDEAGESRFFDAGRRLALLVQLDGLYSQVGNGSVGYIYIGTSHDRPGECTSRAIKERILGKRCCSNGQVKDGNGATLLSGYFHREGDQNHLLTTIDFFRKGESETLAFSPWQESVPQAVFSMQLPEATISFDPRKFSERRLAAVDSAFLEVMSIRREPDTASVAKKLRPFEMEAFSYAVEEVRGDWMKIRSHHPHLPSGWIKVPGDIGDTGLRDLLPELYFMDAAALYMQTRIARARLSPEAFGRNLGKFARLAGEFEKRVQGPGDQRALGLLKSMQAFLLLEQPDEAKAAADGGRISALALEAADLQPTSTEAQSMAALARFCATSKPWDKPSESGTDSLEKDLLRILSADPGNNFAKLNLLRTWDLRSRQGKADSQTPKIANLRQRFLQDTEVAQLVKKQSSQKNRVPLRRANHVKRDLIIPP